jgi:excisionase family DNA binding protein
MQMYADRVLFFCILKKELHMETVFISMPKSEFQATIIDCIKACLPSQNISLNQETEEPLDTEEAASFVNIEIPTLYSFVQKKNIPFHKRGKKLYFFKSELNEWIKKGNSDVSTKIAEATFLEANKKAATNETKN